MAALALAVAALPANWARAGEATLDLSQWLDAVDTYAHVSTFGVNRKLTTKIDAGDVDVSFSSSMQILNLNSVWKTWTPGATGQVLFTAAKTLTITLSEGIKAFGFITEPNPYIDVVFTFVGGGTKTATSINGRGGASFWGWISSGADGDVISSVTISSKYAFAIGDFYLSNSLADRGGPIVPAPVAGAGVPAVAAGAVWFLVRRRRAT